MAEPDDRTSAERAVRPDHGQLLGAVPPRDALAPGVPRGTRVSARAIVRACPRSKRRLGGGDLWDEGDWARPVGDKVTAAVLRSDLRPPRLAKTADAQWSLCASPVSVKAPPLAAGIFY